jgi:UDP-N-acetylglucosamine 1-carboxyvinyltransferase
VHFIGVGGCKLGKRSLDTFDDALEQCGVTLTYEGNTKIYKKSDLPKKKIVLQEFSVTATEAILTYLSFLPDAQGNEYTLYQAAIEPHVLNLVDFLKNIGADIEVNYDHSITIRPATISIKSNVCTITGDYLEAGMFLAI